jgi:hypothetical protein
MKFEKIILRIAIALTAFGASLGLLEIGAYVRAAFQPIRTEFKPLEPLRAPVFAPTPLNGFSTPASTPIEESMPIAEADLEDYGVNGDYFILGDNPKGFENVGQMTIQDRDWSEKANKLVPIKPRGLIDAGDTTFDFSWISIDGKRVSLVTETHRGISYQFSGKFIEQEVTLKGDDGEEYTETVYLKGRLSKWRNGVKIAETKVRYYISHGC